MNKLYKTIGFVVFFFQIICSFGIDNGFSPDEPLDLVERILLHGSTHTVSAINDFLFDSSSKTARKAADLFSRPHSTLLINFRQRPLTTSSILTIGSLFRLEISGIKDEVRLNIGGDLTEVFNYRLADGNLHRLALSFSPNHVEMRVNCSVVYRRPTSFSSPISIDNSNYPNLRIAQYFKGYLKEMIIVSGSNGYSMQCPNSDIPCPSCEQFHNLVELTKRMEQRIEELEKRLNSAESTLKWVKETESGKFCLHSGRQYKNLEKFHDKQCLGYECRNGFVKRLDLREVCPKLENCLYGTYRGPNDCCERCSKYCPVKSGFAERFEGETWTTIRSNVCEKWECSNGMRISRIKREYCPDKLKCSNPVWVPNSCCRQYCKKDACKAAGCSRNAVCHIHLGEAQCKCKKGYRGDGRRCIDINECETYEKCPYPHSCLNIPGSYQCNCATGYENRHGQCVDTRSCKEDSQCNSNAKCINKVCECLPGYDGDGRMCQPICKKDCRNGGLCVGRNTCKCQSGFYGTLCEKDIDECLQRSSTCGKNSLCKNIFGSYECNCKKGFQRQKLNKECVDINECKIKSLCPVGTRCVNREGSFECIVEDFNLKGCMDEGLYHNHTDKWKREESCRTMTCINGKIQSRYDECQCGKDTRDCCKTQCSHKEEICIDEYGIRRPSRFEWKSNCKVCQCFNGFVDCSPVFCPKLNCSKDKQKYRPGTCCPVCVSTNFNQRNCVHDNLIRRHSLQWRSDDCTVCSCNNGSVFCKEDCMK